MSGLLSLVQSDLPTEFLARGVQVALRVAGAGLLGAVVALLYWHSRSRDTRTSGFAHTLVLLAPLIAMITIAVGQNVAAAFTLVGTLAIVRFRTAVRDSRDMAFVIFSVAVGMAMGALNLLVASCGVAIVGGMILLLRRLEVRQRNQDAAILRLVLSPPEADPALYVPILERFGLSHAVRRSTVDRATATLDLRLAVSGLAAERSPQLLAALLQLPEVVKASFAPEEAE